MTTKKRLRQENEELREELKRVTASLEAHKRCYVSLVAQLNEALRAALPPRDVNMSLRRFVLTYIDGAARDYIITVYDTLIAAIETNTATHDQTLSCREWSEQNQNRFNAEHTTGFLYRRNERLSFHHKLRSDEQKRFKSEFDTVLHLYRTATHNTHVKCITEFVLVLARAQFEREFLLRQHRKLCDLDDREASHLCHNSLCLNITHLTFEHHLVNIDRNSCSGPGHCSHTPQCLHHGYTHPHNYSI